MLTRSERRRQEEPCTCSQPSQGKEESGVTLLHHWEFPMWLNNETVQGNILFVFILVVRKCSLDDLFLILFASVTVQVCLDTSRGDGRQGFASPQASIISFYSVLKLKRLFVCPQTLQEVINIQPNLTKSSGSCDTSSALLTLSTDAEKTNLTFVFTLVTSLLSCVNSLFSLLCFLKQPLDGANALLGVFSSEHDIQ